MSASDDLAPLVEVYRHLHANPELSFQEQETAALAADALTRAGFEVSTGIGGTGVVGILRNGGGPCVLLRADMDALPVLEETGLDYASTVRGADADGVSVPIMHACGHDLHVTALIGACRQLAATQSAWSGTVVAVFQPAEELGKGAKAMIDDGLFSRVPLPAVVLGQHVAPLPAGVIGLREGVAFAASDSLRITMFGRGGHGSRPEATVDPVVLAAATVMRLQTVVAREIAGNDAAVVTVGSLQAGAKGNIIPDSAEMLVSVRTFEERTRTRVLEAIRRIVDGEAATSGAPRPPLVEVLSSFPAVANTAAAVAQVRDAFGTAFGPARVIDPGPVTGSEDVGLLAAEVGAECAYWLLGGADPTLFTGATDADDVADIVRTLPSNHSPHFAPLPQPTIDMGVTALLTAARSWLASP